MISKKSSEAVVSTSRPMRYGKQLTEHLGHKRPALWDQTSGRGEITFDVADVRITAMDGRLGLRVSMNGDAPDGADDLSRIEHVLGVHLVRFGAREGLAVRWTRHDGSPGTEQA